MIEQDMGELVTNVLLGALWTIMAVRPPRLQTRFGRWLVALTVITTVAAFGWKMLGWEWRVAWDNATFKNATIATGLWRSTAILAFTVRMLLRDSARTERGQTARR